MRALWREGQSALALHPTLAQSQQELEEEHLLELDAVARAGKLFGGIGEVELLQRLGQREELELLLQPFRKWVGKLRTGMLERSSNQTAQPCLR